MTDKVTNIHIEEESETIWVREFDTDAVIAFENQINQQFQANPRKPITININSLGGEVDGLMAMMDIMDSIRSQADAQHFYFITHAIGKAYSAAAVLLSHGTIRFASPRTRIMIHQVNGGVWGSKPDLDVEFREITKVNDALVEAIRQNCKRGESLEDMKLYLQKDLYFSADEAKDFGLIDVVGAPKVIEYKLYEVAAANTNPIEEDSSDMDFDFEIEEEKPKAKPKRKKKK